MDEFISELKSKGYWESYSIGASEIALVDAKGFALTYLDWLENGKSIYGSHRVTTKLRERVEQIRKEMTNN